MSEIGHNSGGLAAKQQLRSLVERIERLEEEKKAIADDIKDVYAEGKANGFDTKAMRRVIALRKVDATTREEFQAVLDLYMSLLGMTQAEAVEATGMME